MMMRGFDVSWPGISKSGLGPFGGAITGWSGVRFSLRVVFDDPFAMSVQDRIVRGEERWQTLGLVGGSVVLLVAHTYVDEGDEEVIRVISARKATAREKSIYAQGIEQPS